MNLTKSMEIKSIKGWEQYANEHEGESTDWRAYCKPGDLVGEDVYDYFLNTLPPRTFTKTLLQVGEPYSLKLDPETGKFRDTYFTFENAGKVDGVQCYRYCGVCFANCNQDMDIYRQYDSVKDWLKATYKETKDIPLIRPRIICKDGFEFSVQANVYVCCEPRETLQSGEYKSCEVGFPNIREELLTPYIECFSGEPTESIYPYTPTEVIDEIIEKHGGYFKAGMPVV